jgi:hypothetical protein
MVQSEFKTLESFIPRHGRVASTEATFKPKPGFIPEYILSTFVETCKEHIKKALTQTNISKTIHVISEHDLIYSRDPGATSSYPHPGNHMGILYFALIPEFAWEYLF